MFPIPQTPTQKYILEMWFLLRDPKRWTKGAYARNGVGSNTPARDRFARCWCEMGAAWRVAGEGPAHAWIRPILKATLPRASCTMSIGEFNDSRTTSHNDVLAHLTRAYAHAGPIVFNH